MRVLLPPQLVCVSSVIHCFRLSLARILPDGALRVGEIFELCGPSLSGKTQAILQMAAAVAATASVFCIDTTGSFDAHRFVQLARSDPTVLGRVHVCCISTIHALLATLETLEHELNSLRDEFACTLKLLIVDSVSLPIAAVLGKAGHGTLIRPPRNLQLKRP